MDDLPPHDLGLHAVSYLDLWQTWLGQSGRSAEELVLAYLPATLAVGLAVRLISHLFRPPST